MSNLIRWEPFSELVSMRKDLDRLFDEAFHRPFADLQGLGIPTVDMYQTDGEVVVKASLPGVNPDDLDIKVTGDVLSLSGEVKHEEETQEATYHVREQRYGSFSRSLTLPAPVIADKADAEFKNGILTLTIPKDEVAKPKTITVKAK